jgi:hypothetical protein
VWLKKGGGDVMVLKGGAQTIQGFKPLAFLLVLVE